MAVAGRHEHLAPRRARFRRAISRKCSSDSGANVRWSQRPGYSHALILAATAAAEMP